MPANASGCDPHRASISSRFGQARTAFAQAVALRGGRWADATSNLGRSLLELGAVDEAMARWDEALRLQPDHRDAWLNR